VSGSLPENNEAKVVDHSQTKTVVESYECTAMRLKYLFSGVVGTSKIIVSSDNTGDSWKSQFVYRAAPALLTNFSASWTIANRKFNSQKRI